MNFLDYLRSVWDMSCFDDVLAKLIALCIEDLQHERFEKVRHFVMSCAVEVIQISKRRIIYNLHYFTDVAVCATESSERKGRKAI